jgi:hypothetical protein
VAGGVHDEGSEMQRAWSCGHRCSGMSTRRRKPGGRESRKLGSRGVPVRSPTQAASGTTEVDVAAGNEHLRSPPLLWIPAEAIQITNSY